MIWEKTTFSWGFPGGSVCKETWILSLGQEDPLEKRMATHFSILAWRISGTRSLLSYSPWGCRESDTIEQLTLSLVHSLVCWHLRPAYLLSTYLLLGYCFYSLWSFGLLWKCISFYIYSCSNFRPLSPKYFIWNYLLVWTTV